MRFFTISTFRNATHTKDVGIIEVPNAAAGVGGRLSRPKVEDQAILDVTERIESAPKAKGLSLSEWTVPTMLGSFRLLSEEVFDVESSSNSITHSHRSTEGNRFHEAPLNKV